MQLTKKHSYEECNLSLLMKLKGWTVEEAAHELGDSSLRLYKVLEGTEPFGKTATLAAIALKNQLDEIN